MNCLLDTHAFLWAIFSQEKLSRKARAVIADPTDEICLCSISLGEISLKYALGKRTLEHCRPESLVAAILRRSISCETG